MLPVSRNSSSRKEGCRGRIVTGEETDGLGDGEIGGIVPCVVGVTGVDSEEEGAGTEEDARPASV